MQLPLLQWAPRVACKYDVHNHKHSSEAMRWVSKLAQ
jgi:hypothetical protein